MTMKKLTKTSGSSSLMCLRNSPSPERWFSSRRVFKVLGKGGADELGTVAHGGNFFLHTYSKLVDENTVVFVCLFVCVGG